MNNPLLASFKNQPALISVGMEQTFESYLDQASTMLNKVQAAGDAPQMSDDFWFAEGDWRAFLRPYHVKNGTLMIPVKGVLLHDFPYQYGAYATGYAYIDKALERGLADPEVKRIAWVIDSGGGAVAGCFACADRIYAARGSKPMQAFANEHAYSAAYAIASAVGPINVAETGGVGSIGVVTAHFDVSAAVEQAGYKITFIHFGKHKVDGNPYEALSPEVKERIQSRIDGLGEVFVQRSARNRGMDAEAVRATEALTFTASEAVSNGLADSIGSLDDAIAAFAADMSNQEDDNMITQEQLDAAVTEAKASAKAEGVKEGTAAGANAERARFAAIVNSEAGQARPKAAMKFATNDKFAAIDADAITEMLADMPEEKAAAPAPKNDAQAPKGKDGAAADFVQTMNTAEHPEAGSPAAKTEEQARADRRKNAAMAAGRLRAVE